MIPNPLNAADMREVRKAIVKCQELRDYIAVGEACGIDCQEIRNDCEQAFKFLTDVNNTIGPQFPNKSI